MELSLEMPHRPSPSPSPSPAGWRSWKETGTLELRSTERITSQPQTARERPTFRRTASSPRLGASQRPHEDAANPRSRVLSESWTIPFLPFHEATTSNTLPSGTCGGRQPLAERSSPNASCALDGEAVKKQLKGPERFFYDTSGYTGCARFGGPAIVDKENRGVERPATPTRRTAAQRRRAGTPTGGPSSFSSPRAASCTHATPTTTMTGRRRAQSGLR